MKICLLSGKQVSVRIAACLALLVGIIPQASGGEAATATITTSQTSAPFTYTISLHNSGTTNIGSFWYAWNATGYDFLATHPLSVTAPAGWSASVTNLGSGFDGYGIEFIDNGTLLPPLATLSTFQFTSNDTPAQLSGNSIWYTHPPVGTSYVYQGAPQAPGDPGAVFVASVSTVPEPSTLVLTGIGGLVGLIALRRRRAAVVSHALTSAQSGDPLSEQPILDGVQAVPEPSSIVAAMFGVACLCASARLARARTRISSSIVREVVGRPS
jgi:hypothetical protein